jgi:polygalacturonase
MVDGYGRSAGYAGMFLGIVLSLNCIGVAPATAHAAEVRALAPAQPATPIKLPWARANKILERVKPPQFADKQFSLLKFGAEGNGRTDNTIAFQKAITACAEAGGGHVIVPPGRYVTGAIKLLGGVDLHVQKGATIIFSGHAREFPLELCRNQGIDLMTFSPLIYAHNQTNIGVTGRGVLDASRTGRWNHEIGRNWALLEKMERRKVPIARRIFGIRRPLATTFIEPYHCTNVLIKDVTLEHSHWWQLHPTLCTHVLIDHVTAEGTKAHSDGCDPDSCDDVVIENCFLGAGDDCIAIKSGRNADIDRVRRACENLVIINSRFAGPWGLIACGSEQTQGIAHVFGYDLRTVPWRKYRGVRYALYIKSNTMRGGYTRDVHLDDLRGAFSKAVVLATLNYGHARGEQKPLFTDIHLKDIRASSTPRVLDLTGLSNDPIGTMTLRNCSFMHVTHRNIVRHVTTLIMHNVRINGKPLRPSSADAGHPGL